MEKVKFIVIIILILTLYAYTETKMSGTKSIIYEGDIKKKEYAVKLLDIVLKKQGNLGSYGNLSVGTEALLKDMNIRIEEKKNNYTISIYPKSGSGHDFSFIIEKETHKLSGLSVGDVIMPPTPNN